MSKKALELVLQDMREELAELEEFKRPKNISKRILKRIKDGFAFPGIKRLQYMNIRIKHLKRQNKILEKYGDIKSQE